MTDTTIKKVDAHHSPQGPEGQTYLVSGKQVAMRLWKLDEGESDAGHRRDYETVGYVVSGKAELDVEGQKVMLEPGNSWLVPAGAARRYRVLEPFTAVEATSPPGRVHGRDQ